MHMRALFTAGALVSAGVLLSRLLGLLREMLLAGRYGVGPHADMAIALLLIPDFITGALAGSSFSATLIPLFSVRSKDEARLLFLQALALALGVFTLIALTVACNGASVAGFVTKDASLATAMSAGLLIVLATVPLTAASAVIVAYLQYLGKFMIPAFANAIFNAVIVLLLWLLPAELTMLAASIFFGVLARLLSGLYAFYRANGKIAFALCPWQITRPMARNYLTTMSTDICNLFPQFAPYYVIALAGSGLAVFNYAFRLSLLPAMLGFNVAQMVLLPWFARLVASPVGGKGEFSVTLQCSWAFCLAVCLSLTLASRDVAEICFHYGKMTPDDIDRIGRLFALGVWSMAPIMLSGVWQQMLYAHARPRMPFLASLLQAVAILPLCWTGNRLWGMEGIMAAYASLQWIAVAMLSREAHKMGIISRYLPAKEYGIMAGVALAVWLPCRIVFQSMALAPWLKILVAMAIGMLLLLSALIICEPVRRRLMKQVTTP